MDLYNLIGALALEDIAVIGTSLGAAIIWYFPLFPLLRSLMIHRSYAELFTPSPFTHVIYVDQAPLQNYTSDWGAERGNKSLHDATALADLQSTLLSNPTAVYRGTIASCLAYRSHPLPGDPEEGSEEWEADEMFFLSEAQKGDAGWFGKLMGDHTALDWRESISHSFAHAGTKTLVVASERSGCFPSAGPLWVVRLVQEAGGEAEGVSVTWGGHWCYWEAPERFNELVLDFLKR